MDLDLTERLKNEIVRRTPLKLESEDEADRIELVAELEREMLEAAENLEFERAAALRDRIARLKGESDRESGPGPSIGPAKLSSRARRMRSRRRR